MTDTTTLEQNRIEDNLERTRSRMDARLSELQERLSPGQVLDDLMTYFRGSEGAEFGRNLLDSVKNNPLPAALTGIGLTWLMAANQQPKPGDKGKVTSTGSDDGISWRTVEEFDDHLHATDAAVVRRAQDDDLEHQRRIENARGRLLGITREGEETDDLFGQRVQNVISATKDSLTQATQELGDKAGALKDKAGQAASQAAGIAQNASDQIASGVQTAQQMGSSLFAAMSDNPILLGAVGLAVGALLGSLVPQSEGEKAAFSGAAGTVRETATDLAQQVVDRGSAAAQKLAEGARDSAEKRGLSGDMSVTDAVKKVGSGELLGSVKDIALDVLKAGDEAVRREVSSETSQSAQTDEESEESVSGATLPSAGLPTIGSSSPSSATQQPASPKLPD